MESVNTFIPNPKEWITKQIGGNDKEFPSKLILKKSHPTRERKGKKKNRKNFMLRNQSFPLTRSLFLHNLTRTHPNP